MKHSIIAKKIIRSALISSVLALSLSFSLTGCASAPKEIPQDATDREIIQLAQSAYDSGKSDHAIYYYDQLLMRYGNDLAIYVEGKYEIGHIYFKQGKYTEASAIFLEILDIYNSLAPGSLPGAFKKMTENDLSKIPVGKLAK